MLPHSSSLVWRQHVDLLLTEGNLPAFRLLFQAGYLLGKPDLALAARGGHKALVELCLRHGYGYECVEWVQSCPTHRRFATYSTPSVKAKKVDRRSVEALNRAVEVAVEEKQEEVAWLLIFAGDLIILVV